MIQINVEYTDTFGGEANYAWVKRETVELPETARTQTVMRAAKAAVGLTGVRGVTSDHGELIEFRPYRSNTILFVNFN